MTGLVAEPWPNSRENARLRSGLEDMDQKIQRALSVFAFAINQTDVRIDELRDMVSRASGFLNDPASP